MHRQGTGCTCPGCYCGHELEGMRQEPNPPTDFASLVMSPSPTGFALILTCVQSITMCHRDAQCSQKNGSMWDKGWHLRFCSFPVLPVRHWEGPHQPGCSRERMRHSSNCTETAPKQSPSRESLNDPLLLAGRGFMGISPQRLAPKVPPSPHPSQTQAVLSLPPALFAEGIKVLLGKPPLCSDNCLHCQL